MPSRLLPFYISSEDGDVSAPFIPSASVVFEPYIDSVPVDAPFISAATTVYAPTLINVKFGSSWETYQLVSSAVGTEIRDTGASVGVTSNLEISSTGHLKLYGRSGETLNLKIETQPIPESNETFELEISSKGYALGEPPTIVGTGAVTASTSSGTVNYPAGIQVNDTLIIIAESPSTSTIGAQSSGFRTIANVPLTGQTKLTIMVKPHYYTSETSVSLVASDHFIARCIAIRGAWSYRHSIDAGNSGTAVGANQIITIPGCVATDPDCIVFLAACHGLDDATAGVWSSQSNPDVMKMTEQFENATALGNGGGIMLASCYPRPDVNGDPLANFTVVNSLTNPTWAGTSFAFEPSVVIENDNFADATLIELPPLDEPDPAPVSYPGFTYNATKESGELTTVGGITLANTRWWKYEAEQRQIVSVKLIADEPLNWNSADLWVWPRKGTLPTNVSQYATVSISRETSFGHDNGKGLNTSSISAPPFNLSFPTNPLRVQVTPEEPLYLQVGRNDVTAAADYLYHLDVQVKTPPGHDDFSGAFEIQDNIDGQHIVDLDGATGMPGFLPDAGGGGIRNWGDVWYTITPTETRQFAIRIIRDQLPETHNNEHIVVQAFQGTELTYLRTFTGALENQESLHRLFTLEAGVPYYFVVMLNGANYDSNAIFDQQLGGVLDWIFIDSAPVNDNLADAIDLGNNDSGSTNIVNLQGATVEVDEPVLFGGSYNQYNDGSVWYEFTPLTGGWYKFVLDIPTSNFTVVMDAYRGTDFTNMELASFDAMYEDGTFWLSLRGGETYKIQIALYAQFGGEEYAPDFEGMSWNLENPSISSSDDFADKIVLTGASGTEAFTMEGSTNEAGEWTAYYSNFVNDASTWFEWTCPATGTYFFEVDQGFADPENDANYYWLHDLAVFDGDPFDGNDNKVCGNENGEPWGNTKVSFDAVNGTTYFIVSNIYRLTFSSGAFEEPYTAELNWGAHTKATNNLFDDAIELIGDSGIISGDTYALPTDLEAGILIDGYTLEELSGRMGIGNDATPIFKPVGRATWFKFIPTYTGTYNWYFNANPVHTSGNILFHLFKGTDKANLTRVESIFTGSSVYQDLDNLNYYVGSFVSYEEESLYGAALEEGETYYLFISGFMWDSEDLVDFYTHITRADIFQSSWNMEWFLQPPDNNTYGTVRNASGNNSGNLQWVPQYNYQGFQAGAFTQTQNRSGACASGTLVGGSAEAGEPAHAGIAADNSVWYKFIPSPTGNYKIWVEPEGISPTLDPRIAIYTAAASVSGLGAALASDDNSGPGNYPEIASVALTSGNTYMIAVDGDIGSFKLHVQLVPADPPPAGDSFSNPITLTSNVITAGTTVGATVECGEQPIADTNTSFVVIQGPYGSVWYEYVAPYTGVVFFRLDGLTGTSWIDVYDGDMITNLLSENYVNGTSGAVISIPVAITQGQTYYIRISSPDAAGSTFELEAALQSETPPDNDDSTNGGGANEIITSGGSGSIGGTTDGSTVATGEPDPNPASNGVGTLSPFAGTTWHKYVATADGFIAAHVENGVSPADWYRIGVYEGASATSGIIVPPYEDQPASGTPAWDAFYEVKSGETYWIQVIRDVAKPFGPYTLYVEEYFETVEWSYEVDGFDTTTGDIEELGGGLIRCTGNQAISDVLDVTPQYGTIDLGADVPKWTREMRFHFEVRVVGGQILYREMWYGGDDTNNFGLATDDHITTTTRSLGLLRCRDINGATAISAYIGASSNGQNNLVIRTFMGNTGGGGAGQTTVAPISLGTGRNQHDTGWVSIEFILRSQLVNGYNATAPSGQSPGWRVYAWVDGVPYTATPFSASHLGPQIRYIDWGMFRHPSMIEDHDQNYAENNEAWTFEMRNMMYTNKRKLQPFDVAIAGDRGISHFDGFSGGKEWTVNHSQTILSTTPTAYEAVHDMPGKPWKSLRSATTELASLTYNSQYGGGVYYAMNLYIDTMPSGNHVIARYGGAVQGQYNGFQQGGAQQQHGMSALILASNGELKIRPHGWKEFCVAHLEVGQHYWIEVHTDRRWLHDVRCTVYINGQNFGEYSSAWTYSEVAAKTALLPPRRWANSSFLQQPYDGNQGTLFFGTSQTVPTNPSHLLYYTNFVAGRDPGEQIGPKQVEILGAATVVPGTNHLFPDELPDGSDPSMEMELKNPDSTNYCTVYGWMGVWEEAGPYVFTNPTSGHDRYYPFTPRPRFWEPYFTLNQTTPLEQSGGTYTYFGLSVPVDAVIGGIDIQAPAGGTVQLMKAGSPVGSSLGDTGGHYGGENELWGTTWTPQDVNDVGFGVVLTGVSAEKYQVKAKVYFADEGGPDGISRGAQLPSTGLYNVQGDCLLAECLMSGDAGDTHLGGFWEGGGEPGQGRGGETFSSTPGQKWAYIDPMWLWQTRGDKEPSVDWTGGPFTGTLTVTDYRVVRNPLSMPRFAYSDDDGATWTWIRDIGEEDTEGYISDNASEISAGACVFLDNAAHLDWFRAQPGGWSSGFFEDRPTAALSYRHAYYQLRYGNNGIISAPAIYAVNVYANCRAYNGYPKVDSGSTTTMYALAELPDGNVRRIGQFQASGTRIAPAISRFPLTKAPGGQAWTPELVAATTVRVGSTPVLAGSSFGTGSSQVGVVLYGLHHELLVDAVADPPPMPCAGGIDLSKLRFRAYLDPDAEEV